MKVIMYHYVRPRCADLPFFRSLHIEDFKRQLDYFGHQFGFVSRRDFLASLESGRAPPGVVLTFDDGLRDHYDYVLPLLLDRDLWGLFYVPTGVYTRGGLLDVHRIHLLLGRHGGESVFGVLQELITDDMLTHGHVRAFRTQTYQHQHNDEYVSFVKKTLNFYVGYEHRPKVMDALAQQLLPDETERAADYYMRPTELRTLQDAGMVVGSHTVTHPVLSKLSPEEQACEIRESFAFLEDATGGLSIRSFCHPYGGYHSFTADTERLLTEHRCRFAFNVEAKDADASFLIDRPQALPRYDCNQFPFGQCRMFGRRLDADATKEPSGLKGSVVRPVTSRPRRARS